MDWQCLLLCDAHKIAINRWRPFCFIFPSFCRSINSSEREGNYRITSYWTSQLWMCECVKQDGRRANKSEQNLYWWQTIKNSTQGLLFVSVVLLVVHFFFFFCFAFFIVFSRFIESFWAASWCPGVDIDSGPDTFAFVRPAFLCHSLRYFGCEKLEALTIQS